MRSVLIVAFGTTCHLLPWNTVDFSSRRNCLHYSYIIISHSFNYSYDMNQIRPCYYFTYREVSINEQQCVPRFVSYYIAWFSSAPYSIVIAKIINLCSLLSSRSERPTQSVLAQSRWGKRSEQVMVCDVFLVKADFMWCMPGCGRNKIYIGLLRAVGMLSRFSKVFWQRLTVG